MKLFDWLNRPLWGRGDMSLNDLGRPLRPAFSGVPPAKIAILPIGSVLAHNPKYPEAERIAESLRDFPGDWAWKHKGYTLAHVPSGFTLWVGNKDYGLGEDHGSHRTDFQKPEQAIIWPAVETWLERFKVGFTGRLPKVKIICRRGDYRCACDEHPWVGHGESPAEAYLSWSRAVSVQARKANDLKKTIHVWSAAQ